MLSSSSVFYFKIFFFIGKLSMHLVGCEPLRDKGVNWAKHHTTLVFHIISFRCQRTNLFILSLMWMWIILKFAVYKRTLLKIPKYEPFVRVLVALKSWGGQRSLYGKVASALWSVKPKCKIVCYEVMVQWASMIIFSNIGLQIGW